MRERLMHASVAGAVFVTMFLPADHYAGSNWVAAFLYSLENPICSPYFLALPTLLLLSVCLAVWPSRKLEWLYRIVLLVSLPLVLYGTLLMAQGADLAFRRIGFWALPIVISIAALSEVILAASELLKKSGRA